MILDGYWKLDLWRIKTSIIIWRGVIGAILPGYSAHRINQGLLYSAAIIRKIVEDEKDAEHTSEKTQLPMPPLPIIKMDVPVKRYRHTDPEKIFVNSKVFLDDYDMLHAETDQLSLFQACNQIIHSYTWAVVYTGNVKIHGVLFASDREKEKGVFYLAIADWVHVIQEVIEKSAI